MSLMGAPRNKQETAVAVQKVLEQTGWKASELSRAMGLDEGVTVSRWKNGKTRIYPDNIRRLLNAVKVHKPEAYNVALAYLSEGPASVPHVAPAVNLNDGGSYVCKTKQAESVAEILDRYQHDPVLLAACVGAAHTAIAEVLQKHPTEADAAEQGQTAPGKRKKH